LRFLFLFQHGYYYIISIIIRDELHIGNVVEEIGIVKAGRAMFLQCVKTEGRVQRCIIWLGGGQGGGEDAGGGLGSWQRHSVIYSVKTREEEYYYIPIIIIVVDSVQ
jgi:hypothetical protein